MAEMTLLEAARHLDEGKGAEAVGLLAKAARTVLQHAGDMKKLDQERLAKEILLADLTKLIDDAKTSAIEKSRSRTDALKLALENDQQVLKKSKEEIAPVLEKLAEIKKQTEVAEGRLRYTLSENDRIVIENAKEMIEVKSRLKQVEEAIKQAKADIGAL